MSKPKTSKKKLKNISNKSTGKNISYSSYFLLGLLAGFTVLLLAALFYEALLAKTIITISSAVLMEELIRFIFLWQIKDDLQPFKNKRAQLLSALLFFGLGFSLIELGLIVSKSLAQDQWSIRIIFPTIIHLTNSILMGIGIVEFKTSKKIALGTILILSAFLIHLLYNLFAAGIIL